VGYSIGRNLKEKKNRKTRKFKWNSREVSLKGKIETYSRF
jgi:hypothetical protein